MDKRTYCTHGNTHETCHYCGIPCAVNPSLGTEAAIHLRIRRKLVVITPVLHCAKLLRARWLWSSGWYSRFITGHIERDVDVNAPWYWVVQFVDSVLRKYVLVNKHIPGWTAFEFFLPPLQEIWPPRITRKTKFWTCLHTTYSGFAALNFEKMWLWGKYVKCPECPPHLCKNSCIIRCLYRYVWWWSGIVLFFCFFSMWLYWLY